MSKIDVWPWKAHATGLARSGLPEYEIHWSDAGECVAEIVHGEANATLIAAAPELLEALQGVLGQLGNIEVLGEWSALDMNYTTSKRIRAIVDAHITNARAAIALATGSQS